MTVNPHLPAPRSMAMVRIGGHDYPMVSVPNCATCQSEHRMAIENELLRGRGYAAIARMAAEMTGHGERGAPSAPSISLHVRHGHLPQPAQQRRKIIENRAEQIGVQIMGEDDLVDYVTINEMVIADGYERMLKGEIQPGMNDLLTALRNQHAFESLSEQGFDAEAYQEAMLVYFTTAQQYMDPGSFAAMLEDLKRNPILKALAERMAGQGEDGEDGETVAGEVTSG